MGLDLARDEKTGKLKWYDGHRGTVTLDEAGATVLINSHGYRQNLSKKPCPHRTGDKVLVSRGTDSLTGKPLTIWSFVD